MELLLRPRNGSFYHRSCNMPHRICKEHTDCHEFKLTLRKNEKLIEFLMNRLRANADTTAA